MPEISSNHTRILSMECKGLTSRCGLYGQECYGCLEAVSKTDLITTQVIALPASKACKKCDPKITLARQAPLAECPCTA